MSFDKDAFKKDFKAKAKGINPFDKDFIKASSQVDPGKIFRNGKTQSKNGQDRQSLQIEKQRQKTAIELADSDSEIARRKVQAKSGKAGRQSLISTSEQGASTLGGA